MTAKNESSEKIVVKEELESLRAEILVSEKARIELLQYKLIAVASLAAIGLGFGDYNGTEIKVQADFVLCIIPFVCAYVDLLCYHNTIRILVIASFLKHNGDPYEEYIEKLGKAYKKDGVRYLFNMEDLALYWSSLGLSFLLAIYSAIPFFSIEKDITKGMIFLTAGLLAMFISRFTKKSFKAHEKALDYSVDKVKEMSTHHLIPPHNSLLEKYIKDTYSVQNVKNISSLLFQKYTFCFSHLENGLFPAANLQNESEYTGYSNVWVRDNIHIAHAHYINGCNEIAVKNVTTFAEYFIKHQWRFEKIISGELDFNDPMNRPHIRFNGNSLEEINQKWSHAQNDALGYFLWLFCKLYNDKVITVTQQQSQLLALFVLYFDKIKYWQDQDNGHWEEAKKTEASSIGVVVAALTELKRVVQHKKNIQYNDKIISANFLNEMIEKGWQSLKKILPAECIQVEKKRPYDAALLFLIYPLDIIQDESMEDKILKNVFEHLQGDYGIHRYIGDSYWSADYKEKLKPEQRTIDVSDDMSSRDSLLQTGQEAQWCVFDPIMSVIYGKKYQKTKKQQHLQLQTYYFNRSLAQLTPENSPFGGFKCPELYYLENGNYVPNDTTPLLWTQANLWIAFKFMEQNSN